jgi:hypothetical protein
MKEKNNKFYQIREAALEHAERILGNKCYDLHIMVK